MGLRMDLHESVRVLDPEIDDAVFGPLVADYQRLAGRRGAPPDAAAIFRLRWPYLNKSRFGLIGCLLAWRSNRE